MNITAILGTRCLFFMCHFHLFFRDLIQRLHSGRELPAASRERERENKLNIGVFRDMTLITLIRLAYVRLSFFFFYLWYLHPFSCGLTQNMGKWESKDIQILLLLYSDIKYPWSQIEELMVTLSSSICVQWELLRSLFLRLYIEFL